jgi:DNA-binding GntR family transcriptional regulator
MRLSNYIKDDLRLRIQSGAGLPCNLTLTGLSDFYRVSPMPVRTAISALISERFLHQEDNGRFAINPMKLGSKKAVKEHRSIAPPTDWYKVIADDVIRQGLRGRSTPMRIAATADRFAIGRTLVNGIFHRLAGAGLLIHTPRCGWAVRPYRETDLDAYIDVRETLELRALALTQSRLESAELLKLLEKNKPGEGGIRTRFDNGLHRYWIELARNRYIQDFFDRHGAYYDALLAYAALGDPLLAELARQHRTILEALISKKWRHANEALVEDIRRLRPILKDTIQSLEASELTTLSRRKNG